MEGAAANIERTDRAAVGREIQDFIRRNPNVFGAADIYNLDFASPLARAGILAAVLVGLTDEQNRVVVRRFAIVVPPSVDRARAFETVWAQFVDSFRGLAQRELQASEAEVLKERLDLIVAPDRRHSSVLDVLAKQTERTAVIVTEAASYRGESIEPHIPPGALTPLQPEDVWAPQLHVLASAATGLAQQRTIYVALDANELSPRRQALAELLLTVEGCGVMGASSDEDPETILAGHVGTWDAWIREGRLGQALKGVDQLPKALDRQKAYLRIQLLHRAGHLEEALGSIRQRLHEGSDLDPSSRVKLARIAEDANASSLAADLLKPAVDILNSREDLESALATALDGNLTNIEDKVIDRLGRLFPGAMSLERRHLRRLVRDRDYGGAAIVALDKLGDRKEALFYEVLARHLSGSQVPDYHALLAEAGGDGELAEAYRMASVSDALSRSLLVHAFELAMPLPATQSQAQRGERMLMETLKALLLVSSKGGGWPVPHDRFQTAVLALVERLASNPDNRALRIHLAELLQPGVAGTIGLALIAALVLELASRPIELRKGGAPGTAEMGWLMEHKSFLNAALAWMKSEGPVVIGRLMLPAELLTEPADEVVSAIASYLTYAPIGDPEDTSAILTWLALGASVALHTTDKDYDLRLIRLVAGKLASGGDAQNARDLAEQALTNSKGSARRRRLGWFAMADVYARGGNLIEGLLAIACTFASDDSADEEEAYQEIAGIARLFRDCGLHNQARAAIGKARDLLDQMDLHSLYGHQLDTIELQLRYFDLQAAENDVIALGDLLSDAVTNGRDALTNGGLTAPIAALLGQLIRTARQKGIAVPIDADEIFNELRERTNGMVADLIATMSAANPTADELLAVVRGQGLARYSDDVGFDMRNVAIAAGRALISDELLKDPERTSFVLDLLADRGVALPDWDEAAAPAPAPMTIRETAAIARTISQAGLGVVQAGFDETGHLVRVATVSGSIAAPVREPAEIISEKRMTEWAAAFPYAYGIDEDTANLFYTTTADLRFSQLPAGPTVLVADASLQAFPPNLLFVDDDFAGRTRPMAAAPSLAWLGRARELSFIGDGRMHAWISTAAGDESRTLPMIAERLQPTFEQYGFLVDNGPVLPADFAGATLAVVTAHGGVHSEGRYFQVVSDEGILRVTAADLANALRNIGVVVLFVCSGGRADKHPAANTTLGLAKQIVDRGCSAVVASPWPLDARVPSYWLPAFLDRWIQGSMLIEANFCANQVVDGRFSRDPARGLAMTVYGNPELSLR